MADHLTVGQRRAHERLRRVEKGGTPPTPSVRDLTRVSSAMFDAFSQEIAALQSSIEALARIEALIDRMRDVVALATDVAEDGPGLVEQYDGLRRQLDEAAADPEILPLAEAVRAIPHRLDAIELTRAALDRALILVRSAVAPLIQGFLRPWRSNSDEGTR